MKFITIMDGDDIVVRFKNASEYMDVLKGLLGIEEVPSTNLIPLLPENEKEEIDEINTLQNNEKLQYLKNQICEVSSDLLRNKLHEKGVSEKEFFQGKHPNLIDELYELIKEYEEFC